MPLSEEDLKFVLSIDADTAETRKALDDMAAATEDAASKMAAEISKLGIAYRSGADNLDEQVKAMQELIGLQKLQKSIAAVMEPTEKVDELELVKERSDHIKDITKELNLQQIAVDKMK